MLRGKRAFTTEATMASQRKSICWILLQNIYCDVERFSKIRRITKVVSSGIFHSKIKANVGK